MEIPQLGGRDPLGCPPPRDVWISIPQLVGRDPHNWVGKSRESGLHVYLIQVPVKNTSKGRFLRASLTKKKKNKQEHAVCAVEMRNSKVAPLEPIGGHLDEHLEHLEHLRTTANRPWPVGVGRVVAISFPRLVSRYVQSKSC